ncbi:MAG: potassium-transporting ATPase subunit KdpB [Leptospira sp.]|nr:potassium-transporting ATPase subunit KdpB [Leptospira sp.]
MNHSNTLRSNESIFQFFKGQQFREALKQSFILLHPKYLAKNPVMFLTEVGAILTTIIAISELFSSVAYSFSLTISVILWLTVLFGTFAEALAEARGKAQANSLKQTKTSLKAKKIQGNQIEMVDAESLRIGDIVSVSAGEMIPCDGEIISGVASVDESAITGESAPVIREAGGDRSGVTGGTKVISDQIMIRVSVNPGETFLDKMIQLVEGAVRQKTPNELALTVTLSGLSLAFLIVTVTLYPIAKFFDVEIPIPILVSLLVCLIPTTIGALLSAIGLAGLDRALRANILSKSGKAVELAGDIDTLLLDKTGTITMGNRQAKEIFPLSGFSKEEVNKNAFFSSFGDETAEGRSIYTLLSNLNQSVDHENLLEFKVIPFSAETRMSGIETKDGDIYRKGAYESIKQNSKKLPENLATELESIVERVASKGSTPLVISKNDQIVGVITLTDILKKGIKERFTRLRSMGIRIIMVTGDNPLTAGSIAKEAGVDDFIANATPERKLEYIRESQKKGHLVAMMGDGTNDSPALAQADIGVAMNSGTQAAKEAGNMIDLDSDPTKIIEVIEIGKQLLMTRGALTTFSIANDVAKYFAIIPAIFLLAVPGLSVLNIMRLSSPNSAILSALIFNAIIIPLLIPIALKGVKYIPAGADSILRRNLLIYGLGGLIAPFIGIKAIDMILSLVGV